MPRFTENVVVAIERGGSESPPEAALAREQKARDRKRTVKELQAERLKIVMELVKEKNKDDEMLDIVAAMIRQEVREEEIGAKLVVKRRVIDESTCLDRGRQAMMSTMRKSCGDGKSFDEAEADRLIKEVYDLVEQKLNNGEGQIEGSKQK